MTQPGPSVPQLSLPVAIVIAAVLIAGSILLTRGGTMNSGLPKTGTIDYSIDDLKTWARKAKLDVKAFSACLDAGTHADRVARDLASGEELGVGGTPSFFVNGVMIQPPGAQPLAVFQEYIGKAEKREVALNPDDHVLGNENAPVTLIEYSDFQCPFCRSFFSETLGAIKEQYLDTGKVRFVYRHFPIARIHPMAEPSARASECAGEQGKFWEMHDVIFELQAK